VLLKPVARARRAVDVPLHVIGGLLQAVVACVRAVRAFVQVLTVHHLAANAPLLFTDAPLQAIVALSQALMSFHSAIA
jgi:hypothetical protein